MVTKIPITQGIIRAARLGHYPGGPLALGIFLKVPGVRHVHLDSTMITVVRDGGQVERYSISPDLDGWLQYFNLGDQVPAGILKLGKLHRKGGPEQAAWFEEYDGEPYIEVLPWGPMLIG